MTKALWDRYAESWSMPEAERLGRLAETVAAEISYTDPHVTLTGIPAFSQYIGGFQTNLPGAGFEIREAAGHHGRTLAQWNMVASDKSVIGTGVSFADLGEDGKLARITGFFAVS